MPPRGQTEIVAPNTILNGQQLLNEEWKLREYKPIIPEDNPFAAIQRLATHRLLKNTTPCNICRNGCSISQYGQSVNDKYHWKCANRNYTESIRNGSFFTRSNLSLAKIILIIYFWAKRIQQNVVIDELELGSNHTIIDWFNFIRDVCETHLLNIAQQIGEVELEDDVVVPKVVEIEESKFFHHKYYRGAWREGHWVFSGIEGFSEKFLGRSTTTRC